MGYPISAGLIISIAIRCRHDFGLVNSDQQVIAVRQAGLLCQKVSAIIDSNKTVSYFGDQMKAFEEITGRGYYRPDIELVYRSWSKDEALLEAIRIAKEVPEYSGIVPNLSVQFPDAPRMPTTTLVFDGAPHPSFELQDYLIEQDEEDS